MKREELEELHYIVPIVNVPSICVHGILSHNKAETVEHESCAMQEIQDRRAKVIVPGGKPLHEYANLYFHARNPMMYKRKKNHIGLCILVVSTDVMDLPGAVITDCNAASDIALFKPAPNGLDIVDRDLVFAESWIHYNPIETYYHRLVKCAEVLVPNKVETRFMSKVYVSCSQSRDAMIAILSTAMPGLEVVENGYLFFR